MVSALRCHANGFQLRSRAGQDWLSLSFLRWVDKMSTESLGNKTLASCVSLSTWSGHMLRHSGAHGQESRYRGTLVLDCCEEFSYFSNTIDQIVIAIGNLKKIILVSTLIPNGFKFLWNFPIISLILVLWSELLKKGKKSDLSQKINYAFYTYFGNKQNWIKFLFYSPNKP